MKHNRLLLSITLIGILVFIQLSCSKTSNTNNITTPNPPSQQGSVYTNVVYGTNKDWLGVTQSLDMDIYEPTHMEAGKKYPLAVNVHGGSFYIGDKANATEKCQIFADSGFVAVTINYRLGWDGAGASDCMGDTASLHNAVYRAMQDMNASVRFLVANADKYSIDTNWIFVSGASAGGVIVQTSSYETDNYIQEVNPSDAKKFGGLQSADNNLTNKYTIKGISSIAGALTDSTLITSRTAFPTIFFQGGEDDVIPVDHGTYLNCPNYEEIYGSLCLYRRLVANGVPAVVNILPGSGHGNNGDSGYDDPFMIGNSACFFHRVMKNDAIKSAVYMGTVYSCQ